jgi:hypothetical protein
MPTGRYRNPQASNELRGDASSKLGDVCGDGETVPGRSATEYVTVPAALGRADAHSRLTTDD